MCVCVCVCVFFLIGIDRANRLTDGQTSVVDSWEKSVESFRSGVCVRAFFSAKSLFKQVTPLLDERILLSLWTDVSRE